MGYYESDRDFTLSKIPIPKTIIIGGQHSKHISREKKWLNQFDLRALAIENVLIVFILFESVEDETLYVDRHVM